MATRNPGNRRPFVIGLSDDPGLHVFARIVDSLNEAMLGDARWPEASALTNEAGARAAS